MESQDNLEKMQQAFTEYIEAVKNLPLLDKKREVINSIKELISSIDLFAKNEGIELHYLTSKEVLDINNENMPEDDYTEALLVYIETAKSLIGEYLLYKMQ